MPPSISVATRSVARNSASPTEVRMMPTCTALAMRSAGYGLAAFERQRIQEILPARGHHEEFGEFFGGTHTVDQPRVKFGEYLQALAAAATVDEQLVDPPIMAKIVIAIPALVPDRP